MQFVAIELYEPFDPASWSSGPAAFYGELRERGLLLDAIVIDKPRWLTWVAYACACIRWPFCRHSDRIEYAVRVTRRYLLDRRVQRIRKNWPPDTVICTTSYSFLPLENLPYRVWHYTDATWTLFAQSKGRMTQIDNVLAQDETVKFQKLDRLCLFSQWAAQSAISHHGMRPEKIRVIGHGACIPDPGTCVRIGRASFPQILFVCTDWRRKGGDLILQSFQQIRKRHPQAQLIIIGNGQPPPSACMEGIVCVGPLKKNVPTELTEFVDWYRRASVFVLGSTYDPMPHVTLEANYCGIPVVATDVCAMSEQIRNGENGFLVKPDPIAFADAVDAVLVAGDGLRASSRAFVEEHFTWKSVIDRLLA